MSRCRSLRFFLAAGVAAGCCQAAHGTPTEPQPFRYDAKGRRDPFVPLVREGRTLDVAYSASGSTPMLSGILWDPAGHSIALLNETEARVGDVIGEYEVREIRKDSVVLSRGGESVVVQLMGGEGP